MTRRIAGSLLAGGLALACAGGTGAATGPSTIRITDVQVHIQHFGRGVKGSRAGGRYTVRVRLYNPSISSKPIGSGNLLCTYLDNRNRWCAGAYTLPKGRLVVAGLLSTRLLYEFAVVGGTRLYDNARGSLVATATKFKPRHEVLVFRLKG